MRTSLNEIKTIEAYLERKLSDEEMCRFDMQLANDPKLRLNLFLQRKVYRLLELYRRKRLKTKILAIHDKCFHGEGSSDFQNAVLKIFKS